MSLARHGTGPSTAARAYLSQVHPVFMLPPLAASLFGAILAANATFQPAAAATHLVAIFAAVYTAHVKDGYVDFHVRGEDDDHPLTERGCVAGLLLSTGLFAAASVVLWVLVDVVAVAFTIPTWLIAYHHAPQLDTNPVTATTGYPLGIAFGIVGGAYVQATAVASVAVAFAVVFLLLLSGIKVIDDATDYEYDRSIRKRTVAVAVGPRRAGVVANGLMLVALAAVLGFALLGVFPPSSVVAVIAFLPVAVVARRAPPELATKLLIRGSYVFLAALVAAVWFGPFQSVAGSLL